MAHFKWRAAYFGLIPDNVQGKIFFHILALAHFLRYILHLKFLARNFRKRFFRAIHGFDIRRPIGISNMAFDGAFGVISHILCSGCCIFCGVECTCYGKRQGAGASISDKTAKGTAQSRKSSARQLQLGNFENPEHRWGAGCCINANRLSLLRLPIALDSFKKTTYYTRSRLLFAYPELGFI